MTVINQSNTTLTLWPCDLVWPWWPSVWPEVGALGVACVGSVESTEAVARQAVLDGPVEVTLPVNTNHYHSTLHMYTTVSNEITRDTVTHLQQLRHILHYLWSAITRLVSWFLVYAILQRISNRQVMGYSHVHLCQKLS